jgi:hypothetical protein
MARKIKKTSFKKLTKGEVGFSPLHDSINETDSCLWWTIEEIIKKNNIELLNYFFNSLYHNNDKWIIYFHHAIKISLINHNHAMARFIINNVQENHNLFFTGLYYIFDYDANNERKKIFSSAFKSNDIELLSVMIQNNIADLNNFESRNIFEESCEKGRTKVVKLFLQREDLSDFYTDNLLLVKSHINVTKLLINDQRYQFDDLVFSAMQYNYKSLYHFKNIFNLFTNELIAEKFIDIMKLMHDLKTWFQGPMQSLATHLAENIFNNPLMIELISNSTTEKKKLLDDYKLQGYL